MAKAVKKSAKESSTIFHNIMAASVSGNPKPKKKKAITKKEFIKTAANTRVGKNL